MADSSRPPRPASVGPEESWEKMLLEGDLSADMDMDFFDLGSLVEADAFPLQSSALAAAATAVVKAEDGDDSATLSSAGGDDSESRDAAGDSDSEGSTVRQLRKRSKRERDSAVRGRKRKRVQMERLLQTTRQLQAQNAQLLRTLGAVQQMAEEKDMTEVAAMAASASSASLTDLEAKETAKADAAVAAQCAALRGDPLARVAGAGAAAAAADAGSGPGLPPAFQTSKPEAASLGPRPPSPPLGEKERASLKMERLQILREAVRVLNTGDRGKVTQMVDLVHHRNVTLVNPDLSREIQGLQRIHVYWRHVGEVFPGFELGIEELTAEDEVGEKLRLRWSFHGTQLEPFLPMLPPGRSIKLTGQALVTFKDLKIIRHNWSWNHTGLLLNLIGYETGAAIPATPAGKADPAANNEELAENSELTPPGPRNLNARIAETISSMVRSISAGNLALQEANSGSLARTLKRAKSTADVGTLMSANLPPSVEGPAASPNGPAVQKARPKPRLPKARPQAQAPPRIPRPAPHRGGSVPSMLQLPQPYLLPNGHMLPGFPLHGASGLFVGLPQGPLSVGRNPNLQNGGVGDSSGTFSR